MSRLLGLACMLALSLPALGQRILKQSTATTVNFKLTTIVDGTDDTTATVTSITVKLAKQSDTSSATVSSITCAASGSSNDCVHIAAGLWNLELTATNTDTLGRLDVCASYSGDYTDCTQYEVVSAAAYDQSVSGTVRTIPKNVAYPNFPITFFSSAGVRQTGLATSAISCNVFLDGGAANAVDDTTETELDATNAPGVYVVDLSAAETNGDSGVLVCSTTGSLYFQANFQTQH